MSRFSKSNEVSTEDQLYFNQYAPINAAIKYIFCGGNSSYSGYFTQPYDEDFRPIKGVWKGSYRSYGGETNQFLGNSIPSPGGNNTCPEAMVGYDYDAAPFYNNNSNPSSSNSWTQSNNTTRSGEFGHDFLSYEKTGVFNGWLNRRGGNWYNTYENYSFVNSDHPNKKFGMTLYGGSLLVSPKNKVQVSGGSQASVATTGRKQSYKLMAATTSNTLASQYGSASYNYSRKEYVVMASHGDGTNNKWVFKLYKGVDFGAIELLDGLQAQLVEGNSIERVVAFASAPTWGSEARYRATPVLCDDGSIVFTCFHPSNGVYTYKLTRSSDDATWSAAASGAAINTVGCTTSYGLDSAWYCGMRSMQSSDGRSVLSFAPYYYYGAGLCGVVVDRKTGNVKAINLADTAYGYSVVHFKSDGFALMRNGQQYFYITSRNAQEIYTVTRNGDGTFNQNGPVAVLNQTSGWNNGSYPAYTQLVEVI